MAAKKTKKPKLGLYDRIHAKRKRIKAGSKERMKKKGAKGRPTAKQFKRAAKTAKRGNNMPYIGKQPANVPVTADDIPDNSITASKIVDGGITAADIGANAVGLSELSATGTASTSTFLRGDNAWVAVDTNLVSDTSPQLGGNLDLNSNSITGSGGIPAANLTGTIAADRLSTAATQSASDNSTKIATTAYTDAQVATVVDSAPGTLNTLNELAAALGDDANFSTTVTNSIAAKLPLAGGTMTGHLDVADSIRLRLGASNDLQIFHDTNNSYIENTGTGDLIIQDSGGDVRIKGKSNEDSIVANNDGSVDLYHDNTKKFETTSTGIDVTGNIDLNNSVPIIKLTDTDDSSYSRVYHSAGSLYLDSDKGNGVGSSKIQFGVDDTERMRIDSSGNVGIGTTPPSATSNSSYKQLFVNTGGALVDSGGSGPATMVLNNSYIGSGNNNYATATQKAARIVMTSGRLTFDTAPSVSADAQQTFAERMRITDAGRVGIGTTSPTARLHVYNDADHTRLSIQCAQNTGVHWQFQSRNNGEFWIRNETAGNNKLVIDSSGNVGIGTTSPSSPLHLSTVKDNGWVAQLLNTGTGSDANGLLIKAGVDNADLILRLQEADGGNILDVKHGGRGLSDFTAFAWCFFAGSGTPSFWGTAYHNINSITDVGTGAYRVNFVNNAADANNCVSVNGQGGTNADPDGWTTGYAAVACRSNNGNNTSIDVDRVSVIVFRRHS